jgi:dihydrofolate reductase
MNVFIIAAMTADGWIGKDANHLADWTSPEDKQLFVKLTKQAGVIVMGSRTFDTIGRPLPGRRTIVYTSRPEAYKNIDVETTTEPPEALVKRLQKEGTKGLAVCGGAQLYNAFLQAGVVDELYLTYEPILFGTGVPLLSAPTDTRLALQDLQKLNDHAFMAQYRVIR